MKKIFISIILTTETQFILEKKRTNTNEHDGHSQKTFHSKTLTCVEEEEAAAAAHSGSAGWP